MVLNDNDTGCDIDKIFMTIDSVFRQFLQDERITSC